MAGSLLPTARRGRATLSRSGRAAPARPALVDPLDVGSLYTGDLEKVRQPDDVVEFVVSDAFLNRPQIYPRQATILKVIFLQTDSLCVDDQTEVLTRRGWLRYDQVQAGEDVLQLVPETGAAEWAPAERINVFPAGPRVLLSMEGDGHSSLSTLNHRWPVERRMQSRKGPGRWDRRFVESRDLGSRDRVECAAPVVNLPAHALWSDHFVELAAWYWTEGTMLRGDRAGVWISQSKRVNPTYVDRIRACLLALFGPASASMQRNRRMPQWREDLAPKDMAVFKLNGAASVLLRQVVEGFNKVPRADFLGGMTQAQLDLFIDASICADGTAWTMPSGLVKREITQRVKARLDALQMACSLAGVRTVLREEVVRGNTQYAGRQVWHLSLYDVRRHVSFQRTSARRPGLEVRQVLHEGIVWCPTTKHGTWLARRNGKVYFTGNTQYDYDVLGEWGDSFRRTGENGCQPDVLDRMAICRAQGRPWFREVVSAIGRRGSKGYVGGLAGARVLWHYMSRPGGPQDYYGLDRDKRLSALVFGGKREAALANQWRDLANVVLGAPCFTPFVSRPLAQSLTVFAPTDLLRAQERALRGVDSEVDLASFELVPKEATALAGRGPTSFMMHFDEFAHLVPTGALRGAEEVWDAATPSLDQFGLDAFIYQGSSTWQMAGQFYENWLKSLELEEDGSPAYPEVLMFQLTSWDPYKDWDRAELLPYRPSTTTTIDTQLQVSLGTGETVPVVVPTEVEVPARTFQPLRRAIQTYDDQMRQLERAKPDTFNVERRSLWASVLDAYLDQDDVRRAFAPWRGRVLRVQGSGALGTRYKAHGDPARVNDRFGFAVGHVEVGEDGLDHVVFDVVHKWEAPDWADNKIHYVGYDEGDPNVEDDLWAYVRAFLPEEMTFDQYPMPGTLQTLQKKERRAHLPKRVSIYEKSANATLNWVRFECLKAALLAGRVHFPSLDAHGEPLEAAEVLELELRFLQRQGRKVDHPSSGPVQSKDVCDAAVEVCWALIGEEMASVIGADLAALGVKPSMHREAPQEARRAAVEDDASQGLSGLTARGRGGPPSPRHYGPRATRRTGGWGQRW